MRSWILPLAAMVLFAAGCDYREMRKFRVKVVGQDGQARVTYVIYDDKRPRVGYSKHGGYIWGHPTIEAPIGWLIQIEEVGR